MRRSVVVAFLLVAIATLFVGGPSALFSPGTDAIIPETQEEPDLVVPENSTSGFFPYLSAREELDERSPINVVVRGDASETVRLLTEASDGEWNLTEGETEEAESGTFTIGENQTFQPPTETLWGQTTGAVRYAYVDAGDGTGGRFVTETLQVHDGDYYGQRYHIRLYESPNPEDRWTIMQAHTEHFDWLTLRHRVDGAEAAQSKVEQDFMALPTIDDREDVSRIYLGNEGPSDANGWATWIVLNVLGPLTAALPVVAGLLTVRGSVGRRASALGNRVLTDVDRRRIAVVRNRVTTQHLLLFVVVVGLWLGIRLAGIALERHAGFLSMHAIAALLYPVLALGIPIATYAISRGIERRIDAGVVAAVALALAIWIDYGIVNVYVLPIEVVVQRALVVIALGMIAAGAANRAVRETRWNGLVGWGVVLWLGVLAGVLFGYI